METGVILERVGNCRHMLCRCSSIVDTVGTVLFFTNHGKHFKDLFCFVLYRSLMEYSIDQWINVRLICLNGLVVICISLFLQKTGCIGPLIRQSFLQGAGKQELNRAKQNRCPKMTLSISPWIPVTNGQCHSFILEAVIVCCKSSLMGGLFKCCKKLFKSDFHRLEQE